jgi:hypothetical protein
MTSQPVRPPAKDPLKSFRGVMAATLIIEAIVVALALPIVSKLGGGFAGGAGWIVLALVIALIATCGVLKYRWSMIVAVVLQVAMIACGFAVFALGVLGIVFLLIWGIMLWMRQDVAKRMAEGRLPSQRADSGDETS